MTNEVKREMVTEICRTLKRLEQTEIVAKYDRVISGIATSLYGPNEHIQSDTSRMEPDALFLSPQQLHDLNRWLKDYPWYVASMLVGLAQGDESMAWGLAYG